MSFSMKDFLDRFFDLCKEYQEEIPPQKMAEILRDYAVRLDGWGSQGNVIFTQTLFISTQILFKISSKLNPL